MIIKKDIQNNLALTFLFPCILFLGCSDNSDRHGFCLKKNIQELLDTNANICFSTNHLTLFTRFKNNTVLNSESEDDSVYYIRVFNPLKDTLIQSSIVQLNKENYFKKYLQEKSLCSCIDSLETYCYKYDNHFTPKLELPKDEDIDKIVNASDLSVCTTINRKTWESFLHIALKGESVTVKVADERERTDFFLYDILGDKLPEIFVVKHFMMPSVVVGDTPMIEIEIYKIESK